MKKENVIILGSGCGGLTAAIYTARANLNPIVIEGSLPGGLLTTTTEVENFPGFPDGVDGFELMDNMRKQAAKFGTKFVNDTITEVELSENQKTLKSAKNEYHTNSLIISTGASPKKLNIPGEKEYSYGKGVTYCATCDGAFYKDVPVAILGGGDSACEEALFLTKFASRVYLIHRRDQLRASDIMAQRVLKNDKIEIIWNAQVQEITGNGNVATGVRYQKTGEKESTTVDCEGIFVAIGHTPNTGLFSEILNRNENGYLVANTGSQVELSIPGVYAAGDCIDDQFRQGITAAGMGCQAAISAERWISETIL